MKIRGTAAHIAEKYAALARDALAAGDIVAGENYLQHAEHYNRIIMANQTQAESVNGSGQGRGRANGSGEGDDDRQPDLVADGDGDEMAADDGVARTIARTVKRSGNGAEAQADDHDADDASGKSGTDGSSDEAVT